MASLQLVAGKYHISFRFAGRRFKRSLHTDRADLADARRVRLDETIQLVKTGRIAIPDETEDIAEFLLADGKPKPKQSVPVATPTPPPRTTLKQVFEDFFAAIPDGNLEDSLTPAKQPALKRAGWNPAWRITSGCTPPTFRRRTSCGARFAS